MATPTRSARATWTRPASARCSLHCRERIAARERRGAARLAVAVDLGERICTPDLLAEAGYRYTLNWCHDDQPGAHGDARRRPLWSIPYPQELNDIPMIIGAPDGRRAIRRHDHRPVRRDARAAVAQRQPLVMGIALHPYLVGQPYRLRHLRRALEHIAAARDDGDVWMTTPGAICEHMVALAEERPQVFG